MSHNFDFEIRQLLVDTCGVSLDSLYSDTPLATLFRDEDDAAYFWRGVERMYEWMVPQAQKDKLQTIGVLVRELRARTRTQPERMAAL